MTHKCFRSLSSVALSYSVSCLSHCKRPTFEFQNQGSVRGGRTSLLSQSHRRGGEAGFSEEAERGVELSAHNPNLARGGEWRWKCVIVTSRRSRVTRADRSVEREHTRCAGKACSGSFLLALPAVRRRNPLQCFLWEARSCSPNRVARVWRLAPKRPDFRLELGSCSGAAFICVEDTSVAFLLQRKYGGLYCSRLSAWGKCKK